MEPSPPSPPPPAPAPLSLLLQQHVLSRVPVICPEHSLLLSSSGPSGGPTLYAVPPCAQKAPSPSAQLPCLPGNYRLRDPLDLAVARHYQLGLQASGPELQGSRLPTKAQHNPTKAQHNPTRTDSDPNLPTPAPPTPTPSSSYDPSYDPSTGHTGVGSLVPSVSLSTPRYKAAIADISSKRSSLIGPFAEQASRAAPPPPGEPGLAFDIPFLERQPPTHPSATDQPLAPDLVSSMPPTESAVKQVTLPFATLSPAFDQPLNLSRLPYVTGRSLKLKAPPYIPNLIDATAAREVLSVAALHTARTVLSLSSLHGEAYLSPPAGPRPPLFSNLPPLPPFTLARRLEKLSASYRAASLAAAPPAARKPRPAPSPAPPPPPPPAAPAGAGRLEEARLLSDPVLNKQLPLASPPLLQAVSAHVLSSLSSCISVLHAGELPGGELAGELADATRHAKDLREARAEAEGRRQGDKRELKNPFINPDVSDSAPVTPPPPVTPPSTPLPANWTSTTKPNLLSALSRDSNAAILHDGDFSSRHGRVTDLIESLVAPSSSLPPPSPTTPTPILLLTTNDALPAFASHLSLNELSHETLTAANARSLTGRLASTVPDVQVVLCAYDAAHRLHREKQFEDLFFSAVLFDEGLAFLGCAANDPAGSAGAVFTDLASIPARSRCIVAPSLSSHLRGFPTEPAFRFLYPEIAEILKADWERANLNASEAAMSEVRKLLAKSCASYAPESEGSYEEIVALMENAAAPTDFNTPPPSTCPPTLVQTNFLSSPNATDAMSWLTTSLSSTLSSLTTGPGKPSDAPRAYTSTRMIPAYARAADPGKPTCFAATTTSEFANAH
ncbi:hypothetical protein TeGR_g4027, partial [Tetraparma gracilis]